MRCQPLSHEQRQRVRVDFRRVLLVVDVERFLFLSLKTLLRSTEEQLVAHSCRVELLPLLLGRVVLPYSDSQLGIESFPVTSETRVPEGRTSALRVGFVGHGEQGDQRADGNAEGNGETGSDGGPHPGACSLPPEGS